METSSKILVTGSTGLIGNSLVKLLNSSGFINLLTPTSKELDLRNQQKVREFFEQHKPEYVFHLAAIVGGIIANSTLTGQFIYENTIMHSNIIEACREFKVMKLLFPGSACSYPKFAEQPIKEESFYQGMPEPTNIAYATAKINGIVMCQSYHKQYGLNVVIPMPTNAYGDNDHFDLQNSHVIPALLVKFCNAIKNGDNEVIMWGSGKPMREFIHADDLASALLFLMQNYSSPEIINVGTGQEITIRGLAEIIAKVTGFKGQIVQDETKPDGIMRKAIDSSKLFALGWKPSISLEEGIKRLHNSFLSKQLELN